MTDEYKKKKHRNKRQSNHGAEKREDNIDKNRNKSTHRDQRARTQKHQNKRITSQKNKTDLIGVM